MYLPIYLSGISFYLESIYPSIWNLSISHLFTFDVPSIYIYVSLCHQSTNHIYYLYLSNHLSIHWYTYLCIYMSAIFINMYLSPNHLSINSSIDQSINNLPTASIRVHVTCPPSLSLSILLLPRNSQRTAHPGQSWRVKEQWEEDPRRAVLRPVAVHGGAPAVTSHQGPSSDLPQDPRPQCQQG